jgi:hypothetical protein
MNLSKCQEQDKLRYEANIHKASFTERRLFYLNKTFLRLVQSHILLYDVIKSQVQAKVLFIVL